MREAEAENRDQLTLAVSMAKSFLLKAFEGENIENVELEEIRPPEHGNVWQVTFGFNRRTDLTAEKPSNNSLGNSFLQAAAAAVVRNRRIYKVVNIDVTGHKPGSIVNKKED